MNEKTKKAKALLNPVDALAELTKMCAAAAAKKLDEIILKRIIKEAREFNEDGDNMIKEEKITRTITVTEKTYICDKCGKSTKSQVNSYRKCSMCEKLFCRACIIAYDWDILLPGEFYGDYPDYMCQSCWDKGVNYIPKIKKVREEFDKKEEVLINLWKKDCAT